MFSSHFSGRPWMFLPRKSVGKLRKKPSLNGPSLGRPETVLRNVVKQVMYKTSHDQFFLEGKGMKFTETRGF